MKFFSVRSLNSSGFSISEVMVSISMMSITMLVAIALVNSIVQYYNLLVEQNTTEQNLMQAAYYLRAFVTQAVKSRCAQTSALIATPNPITQTSWPRPLALYSAGPGVPDDLAYAPQIPAGVFDCQFNSTAPGTSTSLVTPIGLFVREAGGGTTSPSSRYLTTGIFFEPPDTTGSQTKSGTLYLTQDTLGSGSNVVINKSSLFFDRLVQVTVDQVKPAVSASAPLQSLTLTLVARYFRSKSGLWDYRPIAQINPALIASYRDISMTVNIGLRDNWLGVSPTGTNTSERQNGSLYYFGFWTPMTRVQ